MKPRLISLAAAQKYLRGFHPSVFGIRPVEIDTYDIKAIDARLDELGGLAPQSPKSGAANDETDELQALEGRVDASRRS